MFDLISSRTLLKDQRKVRAKSKSRPPSQVFLKNAKLEVTRKASNDLEDEEEMNHDVSDKKNENFQEPKLTLSTSEDDSHNKIKEADVVDKADSTTVGNQEIKPIFNPEIIGEMQKVLFSKASKSDNKTVMEKVFFECHDKSAENSNNLQNHNKIYEDNDKKPGNDKQFIDKSSSIEKEQKEKVSEINDDATSEPVHLIKHQMKAIFNPALIGEMKRTLTSTTNKDGNSLSITEKVRLQSHDKTSEEMPEWMANLKKKEKKPGNTETSPVLEKPLTWLDEMHKKKIKTYSVKANIKTENLNSLEGIKHNDEERSGEINDQNKSIESKPAWMVNLLISKSFNKEIHSNTIEDKPKTWLEEMKDKRNKNKTFNNTSEESNTEEYKEFITEELNQDTENSKICIKCESETKSATTNEEKIMELSYSLKDELSFGNDIQMLKDETVQLNFPQTVQEIQKVEKNNIITEKPKAISDESRNKENSEIISKENYMLHEELTSSCSSINSTYSHQETKTSVKLSTSSFHTNELKGNYLPSKDKFQYKSDDIRRKQMDMGFYDIPQHVQELQTTETETEENPKKFLEQMQEKKKNRKSFNELTETDSRNIEKKEIKTEHFNQDMTNIQTTYYSNLENISSNLGAEINKRNIILIVNNKRTSAKDESLITSQPEENNHKNEISLNIPERERGETYKITTEKSKTWLEEMQEKKNNRKSFTEHLRENEVSSQLKNQDNSVTNIINDASNQYKYDNIQKLTSNGKSLDIPKEVQDVRITETCKTPTEQPKTWLEEMMEKKRNRKSFTERQPETEEQQITYKETKTLYLNQDFMYPKSTNTNQENISFNVGAEAIKRNTILKIINKPTTPNTTKKDELQNGMRMIESNEPVQILQTPQSVSKIQIKYSIYGESETEKK